MYHHLFGSLLCCVMRTTARRMHRQQQQPNFVILDNGQPVAQQFQQQEVEQPKLKTSLLKGYGIAQLVFGLIVMGIGTAIFLENREYASVYTTIGLWGGGVILFTSIFTFVAAFKGEEVIAYRGLSMGFNITGAVSSGICVILLLRYLNVIRVVCDAIDEYAVSNTVISSEVCLRYRVFTYLLIALTAVHAVIGILAASISGTCCYGQRSAGGVYIQAPPPQPQMYVSASVSSTMPPQSYPCHPYQYPQCAPPYSAVGSPAPHPYTSMQMTAATTTSVNSTNLPYTMQGSHDNVKLV